MSVRITIIGYGNVGRVLTNLLLGSNRAMELNLMDPADWLSGAFLDLKHSLGMQPNKRVYFNNREFFKTSDVVFFTAGVPSKHGASRLTTVQENSQLVKDLFGGVQLNPRMRIIAITNPVDVITAAIYKYSELPWNQVVGTGTFLDSQRFSYHLAELGGVDYQEVNALILGEHGESCAPILSASYYQNKQLQESEWFTTELIEKALYQTRHAAFEIRKTEPGTSMAVSHCALRIMECWLDDHPALIPVSVVLNERWMNLLELEHPVCMSVPVVVSAHGIMIQDPPQLSIEEFESLKRSAQILSQYQAFLHEG